MSDDGPGAREVAYRVFAAEFDDASLSYSESDEERAPNYVVTPTGARVNRLFVAGVLTEVERVNDETRRGRVVDPSGAFVTYAGQYQPEAQTFLERAEPPAFVALTGKARTFEPEDSDRVFTSVRPESLNEVDADTRDRWVVSAAEATLDRLAVFAKALDSGLRGDDLRAALEAGGAPAPLAAGIPKALDHYGTTAAYAEAVRRLAVDALELIAGDREEVRALELLPEEGGDADLGPLPETDVTIAEPPATAAGDGTVDGDSASEAESTVGAADSEAGSAAADSELDSDESSTEPTADASESSEIGSTAEAESTEPDPTAEAEPDPTAEAELTADSESTTGSKPIANAEGSADESLDESTADSDPTAGAADTTDAADTATDDGGLGDFDAGGDDGMAAESDADATADDGADATSDLDPDADADDMYQLDDEEREEIESEFGTDFSTGTEVGEPGEADIDVPDPEDLTEEPVDGGGTTADDAAVTGDDGSDAAEPTTDDGATTDADGGADTDDEDAEVDLEAAAVAAMDDLDDGDGAPREAVVERVADDHGVDPGAVEEAIQDALMSGQCYEPGDGLLKPI
ncbi:hypothetical protein [Halorubrum tebenquichense]|uniref:Rpa-associated protein n=1 Tax=Halorubrum tebenquichense DSM 14210 TaxID=1227485 RepID=M0DMC6_9EURY|nr:hypothetical protein [Halorubrum tebenquichense]ELZ36646.1 hypothetical protein C472_10549 [Halorubrum tebenquichense DSM 14210]